ERHVRHDDRLHPYRQRQHRRRRSRRGAGSGGAALDDRGQVRRRRLNIILSGSTVSGGITVGYAHLVSTARLEVGHYEVPEEDLENEVARFDEGLRRARDELGALKAHIAPDAPPELEAFLNLHRMILDDSALSRAPRELIRPRRYNAAGGPLRRMEKLP